MMVFQVEDERRGRTLIKHKQYGQQKWTTERFRPYIYVDHRERYRLPDGIDGRVERDIDIRAYDGTPLDRVVLSSTREARDARDAADNHFEADIPFERRYFIDEVDGSLAGGGDVNDARPHIMHVDIETYSDGGGVDPMAADNPVVSASCYSEKHDTHTDLLLKPGGWQPPGARTDDKGREYIEPGFGDDKGGRVYLFDQETALLGALARIIKRSGVEVLTGWNFEEYDATYLIKRAEGLAGISPNAYSPLGESYVSRWHTEGGRERVNATIKGVDIFDMSDAYRHLKRRDKPPNWRLGTVARYEGTDVEKIPFDTSRVGPVWEQRPLEVMEYNRRDAVLTHHIARSLSVFDLFLEMHRAFAIPLPDTLNNSVLVEMYVMSRSPAWGIRDRVLDSKRTETNDFEGGNTKQPDEGRYEWVFSADVTSEYPNWVRAANLSPETVVLEGDDEWSRGDLIDTPVDGIKYLPHGERLGILPRAVDEMFEMKEAKTDKRARHEHGTAGWEQADLERDATKWFLNSIQGVTGMETHRLSKNEVSTSITAFGRETVDKMAEVGERLGYTLVAGDTDGVYFTDPTGGVRSLEGAVGAVRELERETNEVLPRWARDEYNIGDDRRHHLRVEAEKVAKRAFFPDKKKRYTLWLAWSGGEQIDEITHTGWAIVRSDTSDLEHRVQKKTLEAIMHNRSERFVTRKIRGEMERVVEGEYDPIELARPQGSSKRFEAYGDSDGLGLDGVPYFVAAMVSSNRLLGTDYRGGDKTWMLPVRETETVEVNGTTNHVNYLAIDEDTDLPDWVEIDYDKVLDNVTGKVERVYRSLGWDLGALRETKADCLQRVEVRRVQANNRTLAAYSS
jgi:DNA polymerase elongation subunit (family B)